MSAAPLVLGLAPMEGVTSFAARLFFRLASAPVSLATPFLRVTKTFPPRVWPEDFAPELTLAARGIPGVLPPVVQLMAACVDDFLRAAALLPRDAVPFVELNAGCPSPVCVGKGAGSSMLKDPNELARTIEKLVRELGPGRFALKMRTGFAEHAEFPALLAGVATLPLARLTVHGRTRPQGYKGRARWDLIATAAKAAVAPVFASGDVVDHASYVTLRREAPGISGALVGRGALRNPWVFQELETGEAVCLPRRALTEALVAFALLQDLEHDHREILFGLAERGLGTVCAGTDAERWAEVVDLLSSLHPSGPWPRNALERAAAYPLDRTTIGRAKMLWSYLRSSLPAAFFSPETMRAKTVGELIFRIDALAASTGASIFTMRHDPAIDWLYAGGKR